MRRAGDTEEIRGAILRAAAAAHPGVLERQDLDVEPEIARADGRTVQGQIRHLVASGCLMVLDFEIPSGRPTRFRASGPTALAVKAVLAR